MSFEMVKSLARRAGVYPAARWVNRHVLDRHELSVFREDLAFYAQFIGPGSLCFDVGANFGAKTEIFLRLGAKVVAFEPQRDCMDELKSRLGRHPRLVTVDAAVGSQSGTGTLYVERHRTASSLIKDWQGEAVGTAKVEVTTLDDAIARFGVPQFCKIDVEGFEMEVLRGLSRMIPSLSYEYHLRGDGPAKALECLEYLSRLGQISVNITPAEKPVLARTAWWDKDAFSDFFRTRVPRMPGYDYGDIFIRVRNDA